MLNQSNLEAALAYSRWLHLAEFIKWQNRYRRGLGLPTESPPVCLNSVGKRAYERLRAEVCARKPHGGVLLGEGERKAVVAEIVRLMNAGER